MNRTTKTTALLTGLVALMGVSTTAVAAEIAPLQGYVVPLGTKAAAIHFRQHDGYKELVTVLAPANFQGERTREVVILEPGEAASIPLTRSGVLVLEATDNGATVIVEVRPDLAAGARLASVDEPR